MDNISQIFPTHQAMDLGVVLLVLTVTVVLSFYEFCVYRFISRKSLYNRQLNISLTVLPCFISTIILALQSNIVITLGTIGALAIIRYRTAIKDPIDMVYILWSVHIGIVCGCELYSVAFITSFIVSLIILFFEKIRFKTKPVIICVKSSLNIVDEITSILSKDTKSYTIKNRSFVNNNFDYIIEATTHIPNVILDKMSRIESCFQTQIIECDANNSFI